MICSKSGSETEAHGNTGVPQETRNISSKQPNLTLQGTGKRTNEAQVSRKKEVTKITAEMSEIGTKKAIEKMDKTKSWFFEKVNKTDNLWLDSPKEQESGLSFKISHKIRNERS